MNEELKKDAVMEGRYMEEAGAGASSGASRGKVSWGFYVLVAGGLWAVAELLQSVLYFFD